MRVGTVARFAVLALVASLAVGFFSAETARADNLYARIQGAVTDPSGAALVGAKLTATNVGTNANWDTTTGSDGAYAFLNLPIGTYKISATQSGFRNFTATSIVLVLDQVYVLNIKMELGQVNDTVVVEVSNVQVQTVNTQLGTVISGDVIRDMPLNGRNWIQLQQLQPGVMSSSDRFGTNFATNGNGSQTQQNSYLINGQDSNDLPLNTPLIIPSPDAIAEFNLVTNTINPEYGRNSGAILNAVIRSGSNSFHGDAFDFYRDTFLNTKNFFQKTPAIFHQNQFGGTIGGPVWKDRTFFFFSYQGTRARQPQAFTVPTVFTQVQRNGDWSSVGFNGAPPSAPGLAPSNPNVSPAPLFGDSASACPVSGGTPCPAG
ncbi:MAG: TonB-dependent receptor, partial [Acidobacteria bacterium]